jgi:hypothetical protein
MRRRIHASQDRMRRRIHASQDRMRRRIHASQFRPAVAPAYVLKGGTFENICRGNGWAERGLFF